MTWTAVAAADELFPTQMKRVQVAGKRLLLANAEGRHYCVDELCTHEDYSLWFGCIKGKSIKCSLHGSYFDLESGEPINEPADCPLHTYPVKVEDERVWVWVE
jgi:3-phenylpropionate/trans-cinnamate dioxygenase ferredoxin subunit